MNYLMTQTKYYRNEKFSPWKALNYLVSGPHPWWELLPAPSTSIPENVISSKYNRTCVMNDQQRQLHLFDLWWVRRLSGGGGIKNEKTTMTSLYIQLQSQENFFFFLTAHPRANRWQMSYICRYTHRDAPRLYLVLKVWERWVRRLLLRKRNQGWLCTCQVLPFWQLVKEFIATRGDN